LVTVRVDPDRLRFVIVWEDALEWIQGGGGRGRTCRGRPLALAQLRPVRVAEAVAVDDHPTASLRVTGW
jgi:hypothetical protein